MIYTQLTTKVQIEMKKESYLDVLIRDTIIQVGNIQLGAGLNRRRSCGRHRVSRHLICKHVVLPRRLRCLNRLFSIQDQEERARERESKKTRSKK